MTTANTASKNGSRFAEEVQAHAFQLASPIICALKECSPKLRESAYELFEQLASGELDSEQAFATTALIAEILFPNADDRGVPGLDLEEAERMAPKVDPSTEPIIAEMDRQEATFAERLRQLMKEKNLTQSELAQKVGIGQSAISMMLNRNCRPQNKTVLRIAAALGVDAKDLWS